MQPTTEVPISEEEGTLIETSLRERRPTANNMDEMLTMMRQTYNSRRSWIKETHPTISDIFKRYPRLTDLHGVVSAT